MRKTSMTMTVSSRLASPGRAPSRPRGRSALILLGLVCLFLVVPAMRGIGLTKAGQPVPEPAMAAADAAARAAVADHVARP